MAGIKVLEPRLFRHRGLKQQLQVKAFLLVRRRHRPGLVIVDQRVPVGVQVDPVGLGGQGEIDLVDTCLAGDLKSGRTPLFASPKFALHDVFGRAGHARQPHQPGLCPGHMLVQRGARQIDQLRRRQSLGRIEGGLDEGFHHLVDHNAAHQRIGRLHQRIEGPQPQHLTGVDGVGVTDQPLDLGDGQLARSGDDRRTGGRARGRRHLFHRFQAAHQPQPMLPAFARIAQRRLALGSKPVEQVGQSTQPAGGDGFRLRPSKRAGQPDLRRADRLLKVVGGQADAPLRQQQPDLGPHRAVQPGIGGRRFWPAAFDQPAQDHHVCPLNPRFQRAPDQDLRMRRGAGSHLFALQDRGQKVGEVLRPHRTRDLRRIAQLVHDRVRLLPRFAFPKPAGPVGLAPCGQTFGELDQKIHVLGQGSFLTRIQPDKGRIHPIGPGRGDLMGLLFGEG